MQKVQTIKEKIVKFDCIKIKNICVTNCIVKGKVTVTVSDLLHASCSQGFCLERYLTLQAISSSVVCDRP